MGSNWIGCVLLLLKLVGDVRGAFSDSNLWPGVVPVRVLESVSCVGLSAGPKPQSGDGHDGGHIAAKLR